MCDPLLTERLSYSSAVEISITIKDYRNPRSYVLREQQPSYSRGMHKQDRCEVNLHKHSMRYLFFTSQAPFPRLWRLSIALLTSLVIL